MKYVVKFTVTGDGRFPVDMLRYDRCFPATSEDASQMCEKEKRTVTLLMYVEYKTGEPTIRRWESFMWKCDIVATTKLN